MILVPVHRPFRQALNANQVKRKAHNLGVNTIHNCVLQKNDRSALRPFQSELDGIRVETFGLGTKNPGAVNHNAIHDIQQSSHLHLLSRKASARANAQAVGL